MGPIRFFLIKKREASMTDLEEFLKVGNQVLIFNGPGEDLMSILKRFLEPILEIWAIWLKTFSVLARLEEKKI